MVTRRSACRLSRPLRRDRDRDDRHRQSEGARGRASELQARRLDAVRAWTAFVEHGDDADALVRPEILRSWELLRRPPSPPTSREAPLADEADTAASWRDSPLPDRGRAGRGRAAPYRRGRRPRHRGHRRRDPDPLDVRRPGDAPQGRDRQLRGRRPLGRPERRHQRARPRQPHGRARRWSSAPSTTPRSCTTGCAGPRRVHDPVTGAAARRHRPLHDLGPHPPDRPRHRPGDGPADRDRDAALADVRRAAPLDAARPSPGLALSLLGTARGLARRPAAAAQPPPDRDPGAARPAPRGALARSSCTRWSTATSRSRCRRSRPRSPTSARALGGQLASRPYRLTLPLPPTSTTVLGLLRRGDVARGRRGVRRRPAAGHQLARRSPSSPTTSRSRCARRCSPTRSPRPSCSYGEFAPYDTEVLEAALTALGPRVHPAKALLKGRLAAAALVDRRDGGDRPQVDEGLEALVPLGGCRRNRTGRPLARSVPRSGPTRQQPRRCGPRASAPRAPEGRVAPSPAPRPAGGRP